MLPIDPSPSKQKVVKNQRVLDWVRKTSSEINLQNDRKSKPAVNTPKRKMIFHDENIPSLGSATKKLKTEKSTDNYRLLGKPSTAMSPRKFYLPNGEEDHKNIPLPSTPESKVSLSSSSICFSPGKLDGIMIRKKSTATPKAIPTDSESVQSTPVKESVSAAQPKVYTLSCGLDSPETESAMTFSDKKFSKLGHRVETKTPLQLFQESIKRSTKKISCNNRSRSKTPVVCKSKSAVTSLSSFKDAELASEETDVRELTQPSELNTSQSTVTSQPQTSDEIDKSNNTLVESPRLVQKKLLALFSRSSTTVTKQGGDKDQMVIDAGQNNFDEAHQCSVCRMIYTRGDPNDETLHKQFHSQLTQALKFTGWKKENVAERGAEHRVIYIDYTDPPHSRKKVQALKVILDQELGYVQEVDMLNPNRRIYLYVGECEKQIKGVCIAESISEANKLEGDRASVQCVRASIGINRLWVYAKYRREGVATKLLDAVRSTFGMGMCVPRGEMAFSDPTSHGKMFAAKYTATTKFLVYKP